MSKVSVPEASPVMEGLRAELDRRGIEWRAESEEWIGGRMSACRVERTKFAIGSTQFSCVWGWAKLLQGGQIGLTHGWPGLIECMGPDGDPAPLTVAEIVEKVERVMG